MARITGQQGASLTNRIAQYLDAADGNLSSSRLQELINEFLQGGDQLTTVSGVTTTGIYKRFNEFDKIEGKIEVVTTGLWSGGAGKLETFFSSSEQIDSTSGTYYWNVFDKDPATDDDAEVQFAVSYGHIDGFGSVPLSVSDDALNPTKATYTQYRSKLLTPGDELFTFTSSSAGGFDSDEIFIINISRERYRERLDPGNWQLKLTGANGSFTFIDDSGKKFSDDVGRSGRVFNVVEGDLLLGTQNDAVVNEEYAPNGQGFGLVYPDHGIIILNPTAILSRIGEVPNEAGTPTVDTQDYDDVGDPTEDTQNQAILFNAISDGNEFDARRTENISTSHYFVRATNREFNFSNNPTFASQTNGRFTEPSFERDPRVYVTTVGLFDDANEMLAVAKASQTITKSFDKEMLIRVKLSF